MNIAVLGMCNIGGTIGKKWAEAGHQVTFGVRNPADPKYRQELAGLAGQATVAGMAEAVTTAEVVLIAIPAPAVDATLAEIGGKMAGKIVIDATNQMGKPVLNNFESIANHVPNVLWAGKTLPNRKLTAYRWTSFTVAMPARPRARSMALSPRWASTRFTPAGGIWPG
jgi:predicted dinucleotide-binding enzyme